MPYRHALVLLNAVTPLHVGCGQDVGVVDLPVIRERTTGYPFVPGSGLRGALRDVFERAGKTDPSVRTAVLFGPPPESDEEEKYAGCVAVHDAKLLLLPVRSDREVFLWVTCPFALGRFAREVGIFSAGLSSDWQLRLGTAVGEEEFVGPESWTSLYLEEFVFKPCSAATAAASRLALDTWTGKVGKALGREELTGRVVVVSDRAFHHFANFATVVQQHNRLNAAKTVEGGGLFSVEALPPESVLYGFFGATESRAPLKKDAPASEPVDALAAIRKAVEAKNGVMPDARYLHLGGHESTGLGLTALTWVG